MSKALKAVGAIASIAAMIPGPHQPFAAVAAGVASIGAQLTAPKPVARGSISNVIIEVEPARPYIIGESYFAGILRHQVGYGATLKKVPNPYLLQVKVFSGAGPVEALVEEQFDFGAIGSYYDGFYDSDTQLGARPEASALVPPLDSPATGWGATSKLSGCAAIAANYKFDKDGKVFSSGTPVHGAIWQGEKVYDPRLDSTRAGGSGAQRVDDETTWAYSTNPALHAATYAYGRYEGDIKIFGVGIADEGIDWVAVAAWANDCDANSWEASGVIFEGGEQAGPQQKSRNLDDICAAGGGRWMMAGGVLTFDWHRPRVALATFTDKDLLAEGGEIVALQSQRDRFNIVRPQFTSPSHNWEQVTGDPIENTAYLAEDGERRSQSWPLNLVKDETQAGQLATYAMTDSREIGPVTLTMGIDWRFYRPGDTLRFESEITGLESDLVITRREIDPQALTVAFTFKSETNAKHAYSLGESATPPPTPVIGQTAQERDEIAGYLVDPRGAFRARALSPAFPFTPGDGQIDIAAHTATLEDGRAINLPPQTITGLAVSSFFTLFWDLATDAYVTPTAPGSTELQDSRYVFLTAFKTSDAGTFPADPAPIEGASGDPNYQEP